MFLFRNKSIALNKELRVALQNVYNVAEINQ
jgi:hypothetical protein